MRCPSCGGYVFDSNGRCKYCHVVPPDEGNKPRVELGKVDIFKLAAGLAKKKEDGRRSNIPLLSDCPGCGRHSLFYNKYSDSYECLEVKQCGYTRVG